MSRLEMLRLGNARWAAEKSVEAWRGGGMRGVAVKAAGFLEKRRARAQATPTLPVTPGVYRGAVVMLADVEPPQCWHYRVLQKREAFAARGMAFMVVRPQSLDEVLSTIQLASVLIVYRQPMSMLFEAVLAEARRLEIPVLYEADDVVYRQDLVAANPNLATLPKDLRKTVVAGAADYASALAACDGVISSTAALADDMAQQLGSVDNRRPAGSVAVIENGVDAGMWSVSRGIAHDLGTGKIPRGRDGIIIGYASGSRAHDADLALASVALASVMVEHPEVRLRLFGPVAPPPVLARFADRIDRVPLLPQGEFLWEFAHVDIALAPLLDISFNRFKSHVKYLEAALVGLPLVASPTVYAHYIDHARTGFIAGSQAEWRDVLTELVLDAELRDRVGRAARGDIERWDVTGPIAEQAVAAIVGLGAPVAVAQ